MYQPRRAQEIIKFQKKNYNTSLLGATKTVSNTARMFYQRRWILVLYITGDKKKNQKLFSTAEWLFTVYSFERLLPPPPPRSRQNNSDDQKAISKYCYIQYTRRYYLYTQSFEMYLTTHVYPVTAMTVTRRVVENSTYEDGYSRYLVPCILTYDVLFKMYDTSNVFFISLLPIKSY